MDPPNLTALPVLPGLHSLTAQQQRVPPPAMPPRPPPSPRSCLVCCGTTEADLVKPCRVCESDFCRSCLHNTFREALHDRTRMPPRCCIFMQLYVSPDFARGSNAQKYRAKFLEWLTQDKLYCPSARCSAFIPPTVIPDTIDEQNVQPALSNPPTSTQEICTTVVQRIIESECARFFRSDLSVTDLPGYSNVVPNHIDLKDIQAKAEGGCYSSLDGLTKDIMLLVNNIRLYNGAIHSLTGVADDLLVLFVQQLAQVMEGIQLSQSQSKPQVAIFACPACHIAICIKCKQIEHGDAACDLSKKDQELAMLESFGYKRCPRCGHGVRRMFGCQRMECQCGAHWCWYCLKSVHECQNACVERSQQNHYHSRRPAKNAVTVPENLDGGAPHLWADSDLDFGDEPDEDPPEQVWSCHHRWEKFKPQTDSFDRGDLSLLECNRCFVALHPSQSAMSQEKKHFPPNLSGDGCDAHAAWSCKRCYLIVCPGCKGSFPNSKDYDRKDEESEDEESDDEESDDEESDDDEGENDWSDRSAIRD